MANDLNRVFLVGRLTRDPELRQSGAGTSFCRFSIANNRSYSSGGERREDVNFLNCVSFGRQAEIINQYCRKGKQVAIDGRLQQRSWEGQDGKKMSSVDIVVENLQLLGSPGGGQGGDGGQAYGGGSSYGAQGGGQGSGGGSSYGSSGGGDYPPPDFEEPNYGGGMDDDDIPF